MWRKVTIGFKTWSSMSVTVNNMQRSVPDASQGAKRMPLVDRTPSGIPGLDEILSGGFPRGRVILIVGGPGTGKTILTSQFLANGIKMYGENGAFVSLDETKSHYFREMAQMAGNSKNPKRSKNSR